MDHVYMYSTIQMAKKPAIIATIAATPPLVTKELAAAAEEVGRSVPLLVAEELVGEELVIVPPLEVLGVDEEAPEDVGVPVAEDDASLAEVNEIELVVDGTPEAVPTAEDRIRSQT